MFASFTLIRKSNEAIDQNDAYMENNLFSPHKSILPRILMFFRIFIFSQKSELPTWFLECSEILGGGVPWNISGMATESINLESVGNALCHWD